MNGEKLCPMCLGSKETVTVDANTEKVIGVSECLYCGGTGIVFSDSELDEQEEDGEFINEDTY